MLTEILGVKNLRVVPALFAYLFYRIDQRQFLKYVDAQGLVPNRAEALRIKDAARVNGYVLKNCKLFAWACWTARTLGRTLPKPADFDVDSRDARILRKLNLRHLEPRRSMTRYPAYTLKTFDSVTTSMLSSPDLKNYIGKFVTKKMTFLMKSYGEKRHDLETALKESAILVWYKQYPRFDSDLHMINVAKAQIHNTGQTMITSLTSKSRQRLVQNGDGSFDSLQVDIAVLADVAAPPQYGAMLADQLQALEAVQHKLNQKAQDFISCYAGQYHAGFSEFLGMDNTDAVEDLQWEHYLRKCRKYFDTTPERVAKLFASIRNYSMQTNV